MKPGFYPIFDLERIRAHELDALELLRVCGALGVSLVQVRAKSWPAAAILEASRRLVAGRGESGPAVIVNDRVDIALLAGAEGVHLGQADLPLAEAARIWRHAAIGQELPILGISTHSVEQARSQLGAARGVALPSYLAIGPIFATASKERPDPTVGLDAIRRIRAIHAGPLVAIGGITLENCRQVWEAGADAVAVIAGWLEAENPARAAEEFVRAHERRAAG